MARAFQNGRVSSTPCVTLSSSMTAYVPLDAVHSVKRKPNESSPAFRFVTTFFTVSVKTFAASPGIAWRTSSMTACSRFGIGRYGRIVSTKIAAGNNASIE